MNIKVLFLWMIVFAGFTPVQTVVNAQIIEESSLTGDPGNPDGVTSQGPLNNGLGLLSEYHFETIILREEIDITGPGVLKEISFFTNSSVVGLDLLGSADIYIKETDEETLSSGSINLNGYTHVGSNGGLLSASLLGINILKVELDISEFTFSNVKNLAIHVRSSSVATLDLGADFFYEETDENRTRRGVEGILSSPSATNQRPIMALSFDVGPVVYVDHTNTDEEKGVSWEQAFTKLQDALTAAKSDKEIWVRHGTHTPDRGIEYSSNDRSASFNLSSSIELYGGFIGSENNRNDRDWASNSTVLSGNLSIGSSYSVVNASDADNTAILDGFTITGGVANGSDSPDEQHGAGIFNSGGSPQIINTIVDGNTAAGEGGGIYNTGNASPVIMNSLFSNNQAANGAAVASQAAGETRFINVTVANNENNGSGGGIFFIAGSSVRVDNSILWGNTGGGSISGPALVNQSIVEGGFSGAVNKDPLFKDIANDNYSLKALSPAIDAGSETPFSPDGPAEDITIDLKGNPRFFGQVDLGAFESGTSQLLSGHNTTDDWRMLANPAQNITFSHLFNSFWTQGVKGADYEGGFSNIRFWGPDQEGYLTPSDMDSEVSAGRGYFFYVFDDDNLDGNTDGFPKTISVAGLENPDNVEVEVYGSQTGNSDLENFPRWNLLANPWGVPVQVNQLLSALKEVVPSVNQNVYVWDPNKMPFDPEQYPDQTDELGNHLTRAGKYLSDEDVIAPFQAFWVYFEESFSGPVTFTMNKNELTVNDYDAAPLKAVDSSDKVLFPVLLIGPEGTAGEYILTFDSQIDNRNHNFDAYAMTPARQNYSLLYSVNERGAFVRNHVPLPFSIEEKLTLNMDVTSTTEGEMALIWNKPEGDLKNYEFTVTDHEKDKTFSLNESGVYRFVYENTEFFKKSIQEMGEGQLLPPVPGLKKYEKLRGFNEKKSNTRFTLNVEKKYETILDTILPEKIDLHQNYPNPFNPITVIQYQLPAKLNVKLDVFDILGRNISTLVDKPVNAGTHSVQFDAGNLSSGVYLYRLEAGNRVIVKKFTVAR